MCGDHQIIPEPVVSPDGGVANVVLCLEGAWPIEASQRDTLVLDNRGCQFSPRAAVLRKGGTLEATNSDAVLHTTNLCGPAEINFSLPTRPGSSWRRSPAAAAPAGALNVIEQHAKVI